VTQGKFATKAGKLFAAAAGCFERVVDWNADVVAEVCGVARKGTSRLAVSVV